MMYNIINRDSKMYIYFNENFLDRFEQIEKINP